MDLHSRMQHLAGPAEETPDAVIQGDLARGRRAVRRKRIVQVTAGSAFSVTAVAAALSLHAGVVGGPAVNPPAVAQSAAGATTGIKLASYTGKQPHLFTIDTVPQGFYVQGQKTARADGTTGRVESTQIYIVESPRVYLTVQFHAGTGLTKDQMIKVAGGIHISAKAVAEAEAGYAAQTTDVKTGGN